MTGITSIGAYVPMYRLSRGDIGRAWGTRGAGGERAVAGYDEDAITMAVAAALDSMGREGKEVGGLYFATTTAPYKEKQSAAVVAAAADLSRKSHTADFSHSLRAGTIALRSAVDAVKSGSADRIAVAAADCRLGAPRGRFEQIFGDGAAAVIVGSSDLIATIEGSHSIFSEFTDCWRTEEDRFVQSGERRFIEEVGYLPTMREAISGLLEKCSLVPDDFSKFVFYAPDAKEHSTLARELGFSEPRVQDPLFAHIGNTGAAAALMMLVCALEEAKPGDKILFASYGDGVDAFVLRATENISRVQGTPTMRDRLARRKSVDYGRYLDWRDLVPVEPSSLPERAEPSLASRWRERKTISALYGVQCKKCGTPQLHPIGQTTRVCVSCQTRDEFAAYKFSDKRGKLFTYAVDQLQPTKNSPGLNGVIDFEGGGRFICELTDYDIDAVSIGMPVEMSFRKLSHRKGIINYFWKAKPTAW